jgi:hypothetical protein
MRYLEAFISEFRILRLGYCYQHTRAFGKVEMNCKISYWLAKISKWYFFYVEEDWYFAIVPVDTSTLLYGELHSLEIHGSLSGLLGAPLVLRVYPSRISRTLQ